MRHGPLVFLAAFFALSASWFGFVLTPQVELGRAAQEPNAVGKVLYPLGRPGIARQGAEIYRANGCAYCHSQQVQQEGTLVSVVMTDAGTNTSALADYLNELLPGRKFMGPSVGAGWSAAAGLSESRKRGASTSTLPISGCSTVTKWPRTASCGSARTSAARTPRSWPAA